MAFTRHRYVTFADETLLDLKHFYATMRLTHFGMVFFGGRIQAVVFANAAGWLNEYRQFRKKRKTGHPLGTNEDLFSNFAGTIFAAFFYASYDSKKWPQQSVAIMESVYGPVKYVSKAKEISRSKRRRGQ